MRETSFVNSLIFSAPRPASYDENSFQDQLIFLRSDYTAAEEFPCVFIPARPPHRHSYASDTQPPSLPVCTRVVLYLHGNAEDLGLATEFFEEHICDEINSHVFIVEYPGYGTCLDDEPNSRGVKQHTWTAYRFLLSVGFLPSDIIVYGRSIGTGAALSLVSTLAETCHSAPAGVLLLSPFTSLVKMVYDFVGPIAYALAERFDNSAVIRRVECPLLVVHGLRDELISPYHSQQLFDLCPSSRKHLLYLPDADHNTFDPSEDIAKPLRMFANAYAIPRGKLPTPSRRPQAKNSSQSECGIPPSNQKTTYRMPDVPKIVAMSRANNANPAAALRRSQLIAKKARRNAQNTSAFSPNGWARSLVAGVAATIAQTIHDVISTEPVADSDADSETYYNHSGSPTRSRGSNHSTRHHASGSFADSDSVHNTVSLGSGGGAYGLLVQTQGSPPSVHWESEDCMPTVNGDGSSSSRKQVHTGLGGGRRNNPGQTGCSKKSSKRSSDSVNSNSCIRTATTTTTSTTITGSSNSSPSVCTSTIPGHGPTRTFDSAHSPQTGASAHASNGDRNSRKSDTPRDRDHEYVLTVLYDDDKARHHRPICSSHTHGYGPNELDTISTRDSTRATDGRSAWEAHSAKGESARQLPSVKWAGLPDSAHGHHHHHHHQSLAAHVDRQSDRQHSGYSRESGLSFRSESLETLPNIPLVITRRISREEVKTSHPTPG